MNRPQCPSCEGQGKITQYHEVTHDMAVDAGEPEMVGMPMPDETTCHVCGGTGMEELVCFRCNIVIEEGYTIHKNNNWEHTEQSKCIDNLRLEVIQLRARIDGYHLTEENLLKLDRIRICKELAILAGSCPPYGVVLKLEPALKAVKNE